MAGAPAHRVVMLVLRHSVSTVQTAVVSTVQTAVHQQGARPVAGAPAH